MTGALPVLPDLQLSGSARAAGHRELPGGTSRRSLHWLSLEARALASPQGLGHPNPAELRCPRVPRCAAEPGRSGGFW